MSKDLSGIRETPARAEEGRGDFMAMFGVTIAAAVKFKKVMLAKGLTRAKAKCPRCGNETLQGALAGRKNHMRMWCETPNCEMRMME